MNERGGGGEGIFFVFFLIPILNDSEGGIGGIGNGRNVETPIASAVSKQVNVVTISSIRPVNRLPRRFMWGTWYRYVTIVCYYSFSFIALFFEPGTFASSA